jgi:uncharacterized membrane protein YhaH (DUF805 family)
MEESMFCSNCGAKLDEGAKFCTNCGAKVDEISFPGQNQPQEIPQPQPVYQQAMPQQQIKVNIPTQNVTPNLGSTQQAKKNAWQYFCDVFKKYAVFKGRARRSEYWFFTLFYSIFYIIALIIDNVAGLYLYRDASVSYGVISTLWMLATLLPGWSVMVRRFHDVDKRAWWVLVPIYNLVLVCTNGTNGQNRFGKDPKQEN